MNPEGARSVVTGSGASAGSGTIHGYMSRRIYVATDAGFGGTGCPHPRLSPRMVARRLNF